MLYVSENPPCCILPVAFRNTHKRMKLRSCVSDRNITACYTGIMYQASLQKCVCFTPVQDQARNQLRPPQGVKGFWGEPKYYIDSMYENNGMSNTFSRLAKASLLLQ